jgi:2,3,4,5-tetrahydropyridine-2,6-dicarboxylate N-succinyltransferase
LGANSGVGIALGDDCIVEAGCYITAGAPIRIDDGRVVKARWLSGRSRLIFRRNAQTGALEAVENTGRWEGLNPLLHPQR